MTLIEAKNKTVGTDWQQIGFSRLSFGFTVKRRLNICIAHLQNEPRRFTSPRSFDVTIINDNLSTFTVLETNRWFPVKATGQLKLLDETSTLVSGEIHQKSSFMDWVLLIFLIALAMIFIEAVGLGGGILGPLWLVGFALFIIRERQSRVARMLTELRRLRPQRGPADTTKRTTGVNH